MHPDTPNSITVSLAFCTIIIKTVTTYLSKIWYLLTKLRGFMSQKILQFLTEFSPFPVDLFLQLDIQNLFKFYVYFVF